LLDWVLISIPIILFFLTATLYFLRKREEKQSTGEGEKRSRRAERRARASRHTFLTLRGVAVRSRAEKTIADYFTDNDIVYEYEPVLMGGTNHEREMRPDFYLPEYDVYVEYWGMVSHPDGSKRDEYVEKMRWKMAQYREMNLRVISIEHADLCNFGDVFRGKFEEATGSKFPD
jgi:hypothetical protein